MPFPLMSGPTCRRCGRLRDEGGAGEDLAIDGKGTYHVTFRNGRSLGPIPLSAVALFLRAGHLDPSTPIIDEERGRVLLPTEHPYLQLRMPGRLHSPAEIWTAASGEPEFPWAKLVVAVLSAVGVLVGMVWTIQILLQMQKP